MSDTTVPEPLAQFFKDNPKVAIAFSGGADSSYLLYAAKYCGAEIGAYFVKSAFQTKEEMDIARNVAGMLGFQLNIIEIDVLSDEVIKTNPSDRCYHCKRHVFGNIIERSRADGFDIVVDATNATDDPGDRPGMRALKELGIVSPLEMCGIGKPDIRTMSREAELPTWDMPSNSCLATRIPVGTVLTEELLTRTENAEKKLAAMGFRDFRVRTKETGCILETTRNQEDLLQSKLRRVEEILLKYYSDVSYGIRNPKL